MIGAILGRHGNGKMSQYLACISASIVAFTSGIHYGWTGPSLRKILSPEYPHDVTPDEASYIAIISCVGHVVGGFSGSFLSDAIGRKYTLLAVAVPHVSSFLLIYFSYFGKYLLYCARVVGKFKFYLKMTLPVIKNMLGCERNAKLSQYLACTSACIVVFNVGIHLAWTGPSLRKILSPEYPHEVTSDEASYIAIVSCVGHVIGGFTGANLSDKIGRKYTLLAIAVPQVSSFIMIYFSYYGTYLLYCARVIGGIGEGAVVAVLPTYLAEVASPNIRGAIGTLSTLFGRSGCLFINLLGSYTDIHTAALICLAFPVLHWIFFVNFPETPYYLLMKGKTEKARESLKVLRGSQDIEKEILRLTADVTRQMSESGTYLDLFTIDSNRKAFFLVTAARIFQQFTGTSAFINYYQILIEQSTNLSPVLGSSLIILTQIIMTLLASKFVDKFGRKPLLTVSSGLTFLVLLILGVYFTLKDYTTIDVSIIDWFPLPMLMLFIITFFLGMGVIMSIFVSEIYSTSIKAKGISLGGIVFASSMMASTKFYQYTADNFGLAVPFYSFAASTFFGTIFFHFKVPETKGKTLETIQQELKGIIRKNRQSVTY